MRAQPEVCRLLEASLRDGKWGGKSVLLAYISDSIRKASSTSGEVQYSDETWSAAMPMYNTGNSAALANESAVHGPQPRQSGSLRDISAAFFDGARARTGEPAGGAAV